MSRYLIHVPVRHVHGTQTFAVDADSEDAALEKFKRDGGDFVEEALEVQSLEMRNLVIEEEAP